MIIDCYTHFGPRKYVTSLGKAKDPKMNAVYNRISLVWEVNPHFVDLEARLKHMSKYSIDTEVTMLHENMDPNNFKMPERELVRMCREANDECADFQQKSKGRIYAMGAAPLLAKNKDLMIEEMKRAVQELGLKGFMVSSNLSGKPIDEFQEFWAVAEKLGALVYIHPANGGDRKTTAYEFDYDLMHVFGWPYQTTLMLSRLVFSGTMKKHPNLKVISHHMGGMIPFFSGRISETYKKTQKRFSRGEEKSGEKKRVIDYGAKATDILSGAGMDRPTFDYFKMFYYDTAVGGGIPAMMCGYEALGADRIVFGTDYPWGPNAGGGRLEEYPKVVRAVVKSEADRKKIFEGNMRKLLKI